MKDRLHEQLSALVDDELTHAEQTLLMKQVGRDEDLHERLVRYQLISDAMRNRLPDRVDPAFPARVRAAIKGMVPDAGTAVANRAGDWPGRLLKPVAGLALAASVAVVAVLSLQTVREEPGVPATVASAPTTGDFIRAENTPDPAVRARPDSNLDVYLVNHNEYATNRGMRGMLPYVRIVSHEMNSDRKE